MKVHPFTYAEMRDYLTKWCIAEGKNGGKCPTLTTLAKHLNDQFIVTTRGNLISVSVVQVVMKDNAYVKALWQQGRNKYEEEHPEEKQEIINPSDIASSMNYFVANSIEQIRDFCLSVCYEAGKNNIKMPSMNKLVQFAQQQNYKTPRGNDINISTIQRAVMGSDMKQYYQDGLKEFSRIAKTNNIDINIMLNPQNINEENNWTLDKCIRNFCYGRGFLHYTKPTLEQICEFVNQQGFRTPVQSKLWSAASLHKYIHDQGIDVQFLWNDGVEKGREALGKSNDLSSNIKEIAHRWGLMGGMKQPTLQELSEQLFMRNFQSEKGTRLSVSYISAIINDKQIPVNDEYEKGFEEYRRKKLAERYEETGYDPNHNIIKKPQIQSPINNTIPASQTIDEQPKELTKEEVSKILKINLKNVKTDASSHTLSTPCTMPDETIPAEEVPSYGFYIKEAGQQEQKGKAVPPSWLEEWVGETEDQTVSESMSEN